MKKFYYVLGLLVCFWAFYFIGGAAPRLIPGKTSRQDAAVISSPKLTNNYSLASSNPAFNKSTKEVLQNAVGGELFHALFTRRVLEESPSFAQIEPFIFKRFQTKYTIEEPKYRQEITNRLGILKAMGKAFSPDKFLKEYSDLSQFYLNVTTKSSEPWLVKRQAMQNLSAWMKYMTVQERKEIFAQNQGRVLATASRSEADLLEEILGNEK